jgi:hypothetical protein
VAPEFRSSVVASRPSFPDPSLDPAIVKRSKSGRIEEGPCKNRDPHNTNVPANARGKKSSSRKQLVDSRRVGVPIKPSMPRAKIRTSLASCRDLSVTPGRTSDLFGARSIRRGVLQSALTSIKLCHRNLASDACRGICGPCHVGSVCKDDAPKHNTSMR